MCPFVQDRDYLEDQHLLVALKSDDGMESYGWLYPVLNMCVCVCVCLHNQLVVAAISLFYSINYNTKIHNSLHESELSNGLTPALVPTDM